jgi:hypothetical protein
MDERLGFSCCMQFFINHVTNGEEEWCDINLEMM